MNLTSVEEDLPQEVKLGTTFKLVKFNLPEELDKDIAPISLKLISEKYNKESNFYTHFNLKGQPVPAAHDQVAPEVIIHFP